MESAERGSRCNRRWMEWANFAVYHRWTRGETPGDDFLRQDFGSEGKRESFSQNCRSFFARTRWKFESAGDGGAY